MSKYVRAEKLATCAIVVSGVLLMIGGIMEIGGVFGRPFLVSVAVFAWLVVLVRLCVSRIQSLAEEEERAKRLSAIENDSRGCFRQRLDLLHAMEAETRRLKREFDKANCAHTSQITVISEKRRLTIRRKR